MTDRQTSRLRVKLQTSLHVALQFSFFASTIVNNKGSKMDGIEWPSSHLFPLVGLICGTCKEKFCLVQEDARRVPKRYLSLQTFQDQSMHFLN